MTQKLWELRQDFRVTAALDAAIELGDFSITNEDEVMEALRAFYQSLPGRAPFAQAMPRGFPLPRLSLPQGTLAPDYMERGTFMFVSERMREAMALGRDDVDMLPIIPEGGGSAARAQNYCWMYLRRSAEVLDLERSQGQWTTEISHKTGEPFVFVRSISQFVVRADCVPPAGLFKDVHRTVAVLATDALAQRVLAAGCTGMRFVSPETAYSRGGEPELVRTAQGQALLKWRPSGDYYLEAIAG